MVAQQQPGRIRDITLLGILTVLSTITPRVRGVYGDKIVYPQFFTIITAYPGSGKGVLDKIRAIYSGWHRYVRENSRRAVEKYEQALLVYARDLAHWQKKKEGTPPAKPAEVKQMELAMAGDTTKPKMVEQFFANDHYASLLLETEMRVITSAMKQEHGKFADILNSLAHNESISRDTKGSGRFFVEAPKMGIIISGVPEQIPDLFGHVDDGLASRFLGYMMPDEAHWQNLTSSDNTPDAANHFLQFSTPVMQIGIHLDRYQTFVTFTNEQRDEINRVFTELVDRARMLGDIDRKAFLFRSGLAVFRLGMTLTCVRKALAGITEECVEMHPDDFRVAISLGLTSLRHMLTIASLLPRRCGTALLKSPDRKEEVFISLPDCFFADEVYAIAKQRSVSKRTASNWLTAWKKGGLTVSTSKGYYEKTQVGKHFTIARKTC